MDRTPFPVHTLELNNPKVLLRPEQAEGAQGMNVVIGDPRPMNANDKILAREVIVEKTPDGKPTLRIFVNAPKPGGKKSLPVNLLSRRDGQTGSLNWSDRSDRSYRVQRPVRPAQGAAPDVQAKASESGYLEN